MTFALPLQPYKVRADHLSRQYWSDIITGTDKTILISQGKAKVTFTSQGNPLANAKVYLFNDTGAYMGINGSTGADGSLDFTLPQGT